MVSNKLLCNNILVSRQDTSFLLCVCMFDVGNLCFSSFTASQKLTGKSFQLVVKLRPSIIKHISTAATWKTVKVYMNSSAAPLSVELLTTEKDVEGEHDAPLGEKTRMKTNRLPQ